MTGEYFDYEVRDGKDVLVREGRNLVVNSAYVLLAMGLKRDPANASNLFWALGDGNTTDTATWDAGIAAGTTTPAAPDTALRREIFRKEVLPADVVYVDSSNAVSVTPTNRLRITLLLEESEPSAVGATNLREFGIFGGTATATADSGLMVNHKVHKTFSKSNLSQLKRILFLSI